MAGIRRTYAQAETPQDRVDALLGDRFEVKCSDFYDEARTPWLAVKDMFKDDLEKILSGKKVLEIGPGYDAGLSRMVFELGALSYLGVDINKDAVTTSRAKTPQGEFVFDDSLYIIKSLKEPHLIISSGVFDTTILRDRAYIEELVRAISDKTPSGEFTM
ncbi:MAG: hypothetical protein NTZ83_02550, partial [Candidatus Pacearchaeota archaeon]|nr:hypothetical protein [Candidatus Pacearchaeota archaeon]